jgi:hypothetical protein
MSLILGVAIACIYTYRHHSSRNFVITLALLPLIVQMVIALVNGNIGAGIAVMGVFNLVRFRSIPGTAKRYWSSFYGNGRWPCDRMGFLVLAAVFTVVVGVANIAFVRSPLGGREGLDSDKTLKISIPEDLDYSHMFDDLFARFTSRSELLNVRTTNMGSLYQLEYSITLKTEDAEKPLIDAVRCRNGNLAVQCGHPIVSKESL